MALNPRMVLLESVVLPSHGESITQNATELASKSIISTWAGGQLFT